MASWGDRDEHDAKLAQLAANQEHGWEVLATVLREKFNRIVHSEEQAKKEAAKLLKED